MMHLKKQVTRDVENITGLDILRIINETTTTTLAYRLDKRYVKSIVVYDLGIRSFDTSIWNLEMVFFEVKYTTNVLSISI